MLQSISQKDGSRRLEWEVDILAAAQIVQPGNLVQHRNNKTQALLLFQFLAQVFNLVPEALSRILERLHRDLFARTRWPLLAPHHIYQVLVDGFVLAALFLDLVGELAGIRRRHDAWIHAHRLPAGDLVRGPFLDRGDVLEALLEELPVAVELLLGLVEVAAVGGEGGLLMGDDGIARGAREAAYERWGMSQSVREGWGEEGQQRGAGV